MTDKNTKTTNYDENWKTTEGSRPIQTISKMQNRTLSTISND